MIKRFLVIGVAAVALGATASAQIVKDMTVSKVGSTGFGQSM